MLTNLKHLGNSKKSTTFQIVRFFLKLEKIGIHASVVYFLDMLIFDKYLGNIGENLNTN